MSASDTKDSGVQWIGRVPAHWGVASLGTQVEVYGGATPSKEKPEYWDGTIPWVSPKDMKRDVLEDAEDHVTPLALKSSSLRLVEPPAVLMVIRGMILNHTVPVAVTARPMTINQDMKALRPHRGLTPQFLAHYLRAGNRALLGLVEEAGHGTKALRSDLWRKFPIVVPPLDEQATITGFVDRRTAALDALIAKKERLVELLQEKRQAVISEAVTRGLDPSAPTKDSGVAWLGRIPAHWKAISLKHAARSEWRAFSDGDWIEAPFITDSGIRLLQTGNVGIGVYREQGYRYVSEETFRELNCTEVFPGDVLICRLDGPVGRACLAPELGRRMITSVDNAILRPNSEHDPRYLVYLLSSNPWLEWMKALCRVGGGHRFRISRSMLGDQPIPIPPLLEQQSMSSFLDAKVGGINRAVSALTAQIDRLREYRQALITEAVTGRIPLAEMAAARAQEGV